MVRQVKEPITEWRTPNRLRRWRTDNGISLDELADLVGLSKSMLSRVERGERGLSAVAKVKVARRLDVPVRELFEVEPIDAEGLSA
ncbi:helix-turn-helix domain-containing protein [Saccharothrix deserti]|uniref:helix-turn-helix domain-containing protein n=1 Tax=Saccharothrix deserti TaxID=2593674 RepID=UPI00131D688E|nr:helix-turn-helix transcriptional regulator [Saccharothrix deserti]